MVNVKDRLKNSCTNVSVATYFLVCAFGTGSWIAVNGLWVELAIIVQHIPEGWNLPSYLTVIIQMANIGPLLFVLGNKYYPKVIREVPVIYAIVSVGAVACALLGFVWKETSSVGGRSHSTALLVLAFFLAMVDCTSSVTFLPYMAMFREVYMSPFFMGEGLSGLLPSVVAIAQGVDGGTHTGCVAPTAANVTAANGTHSQNGTTPASWSGPGPNFSPQAFFLFLCGMMLVCGFSFLGLNYLPVAQREQVEQTDSNADQTGKEAYELCNADTDVEVRNDAMPAEGSVLTSASGVTTFELLTILAIISGLSNGVIPAIQSFACIPYSYYVYHLTLTLSNIANPVTCFVFPFIRTRSFVVMGLLSAVYMGMCVYIITVAAQSPNVLLKCDDAGAVLIVFISVVAVCVVTYTKVAISTLMREEGRKPLLWCGISTQVGSFVGAVSIFAPVNVYHIFRQG